MNYSDDAVFMRELYEFEARVSKRKNDGFSNVKLDPEDSSRVRRACAVFYDAFADKSREGWVEKASDMVGRLDFERAVDNAVDALELFAKRGVVGRDKDWCYTEAFSFMYDVAFHYPGITADDLYWFKDFSTMATEIKVRVDRLYDALGADDVPNDWVELLRQLIPDFTHLADYFPAFLRALDFAADRGELPYEGDERAAFIDAFYSVPPVATPDDEFIIAKVARELSSRDLGKFLAGERSYDEWMRLFRVCVAHKDIGARFADEYSEDEIERFLHTLARSASAAEPCAALLWVDILPGLADQAGSTLDVDMLDDVAPVSIDTEYREFGLNFVGENKDPSEFWAVWGGPIRAAVRRRLKSELPYSVRVWDQQRGNMGDAAG